MIPRRCVRFAKSPRNEVKFSTCHISTSTSDLGKVRRKSEPNSSGSVPVKKNVLRTSATPVRLSSLQSKSENVPLKRSRRLNLVHRVSAVEWNKVYLDRPEIIRRKAKKLVAELEKRHIKLTEASIEKLIRGDPKEYLQILKQILNVFMPKLKSLCETEHECKGLSVTDFLKKFDGTTREAVAALFGILTQVLNYKPPISAVQFMQTRFTIPKLDLCLEVLTALAN